MTGPFPPMMRLGIDEPCRLEGEIVDVEVSEGAIPRDLAGLFVQAVPDYVYPPVAKTLYPMDLGAGGDGMIRALRFADGRADFGSRYVRTERFLAQRKARRGLFGNYRNPFSNDPAASGVDATTANTMINFHAGVLLASKEDGPTYAVDPDTLETLGVWRGGGAITSRTLSAHPKFDPGTGEMFTFGYFAKGVGSRDIAYYAIDAAGRVRHEAWFQAPVHSMIHDCALTPNYFLLPVMPYSMDLERLKAGGPFWVYEPGQEILIGLLPRYGNADQVRWLRAPHASLTHTVNAFEQDGLIKFDVLLGEGNAFGFVVPDRNGGHAGPPGSCKTSMIRWSIDPESSSDRLGPYEVLAEVAGEGAHVDDRWHARPHRYVWLPEIMGASTSIPEPPGDDPLSRPMAGPVAGGPPPGKQSNAPVMFNSISCFDLVRNKKAQWFAGEGAMLQDPVFCQRAADAPEGDGYIVVVRNRVDLRGAEIVILDAQNVAAGPVAVLQIPVPLRHGIHSSWIPAYRLQKKNNAGAGAP